jgi:hypothetical protein
MPVVPSQRTPRGASLRTLLVLLLGVGVLALAACGSSSSSSSSASSADARDTARVKLQQCLREQGVDVPDNPGGGGGGGGGGGAATRLSAADRTKLQQALQGPCKQDASGAFGQISDDQRQEFQDAFTRFSACMRKQGIDVPTPQPGSGGGPPAAGGPPPGGGFDRSDPKVQAAAKSCQSLLPQGGRGAPGGN